MSRPTGRAPRARAIDETRKAGRNPGQLAGVPFAVKNLFDLAGLATRAGSKINRDDPPAGRDATLVERLEAAGAICVGALNMGEYAYDFTGENIHDGASRNPHDLTRMSEGRRAARAVPLQRGFVPLALGSDTNGSIRVPSSLCGLFGLKPTFGRLSRARTFPFVSSLDHLGPLARSVEDLALSYDAMQGTTRMTRRSRGGRLNRWVAAWGRAPRACGSRLLVAILPSAVSLRLSVPCGVAPRPSALRESSNFRRRIGPGRLPT